MARRLIGDNGFRDFSFLSPDEVLHLIGRGHLTSLPAKLEHQQFKQLAERVLTAKQELKDREESNRTIAFILTYQCNLSCAYCYQNELRKHENLPVMDESFVDEFFHVYLDQLFPNNSKYKMNFLLFGGEPLLPGNRATIERILQYAKKYGAEVSTSTNAVALPQMLDLIGAEDGKIRNVQVTLDGEQAFHDGRRVPRSGAPTFDMTIHSLRELIRVKARAIVRIHLHPDGLDSTRTLVEYLDREGILGNDHVHAYFAPINSFDVSDIPPSYFECFSELFQRVALLQKSPPSSFARRFAGMLDAVPTSGQLKPRYCSAGSGLFRVVDARGDVYDCYEEAGNRARRTAKLFGGVVKYFKLKESYERRHILNMPQCLKCSIALYCGGGCMTQARLQNGSIFKPLCRQNKQFVAETLKAYYLLKRAGITGTGAEPIC